MKIATPEKTSLFLHLGTQNWTPAIRETLLILTLNKVSTQKQTIHSNFTQV
jgi:hypothetical protein